MLKTDFLAADGKFIRDQFVLCIFKDPSQVSFCQLRRASKCSLVSPLGCIVPMLCIDTVYLILDLMVLSLTGRMVDFLWDAVD